MHWMPLLYMMEIIWSGCGLATLKVKMRKMSPLFYSFQVIWNWTGNYLLILYNSDQKGICNDISLSLFVLKIGLRLKKKFHKIWNCVFCCWANKAWIWTLSKRDFHQCDFYVCSDFNQGKLITYDSLTVGESSS